LCQAQQSLDADDVGNRPGDPAQSLRRDQMGQRAVVEHGADVEAIGDEMPPFLDGLVRGGLEIGRDDRHEVGADLLGVPAEVDAVLRAVVGGLHDDGDLACPLIDDDLDDSFPLGQCERIEFPNVAQDEDRIVLRVDHIPDEIPQVPLMDLQVVVVGRWNGGHQPTMAERFHRPLLRFVFAGVLHW
jgi:hypothetical protein